MRRWVETGAVGSLFALSAAPFVALFPEPPAFGRRGAGIVAAAAVLAALGKTVRTAQPGRQRILRWAALLLAVTIGSIAVQIGLARTLPGGVLTLDILPAAFGLEGEDVGDALLYEGWLEVWLCCALAAALAIGLRRAAQPRRPSPPASAGPPA